MGLAFLPWEKLPLWILGPLMAATGVFLFLNAVPFSWRQYEAAGFVIIGLVLFVMGVRKLLSDRSVASPNDES